MATNFVQEGDTITLAAPYAVASGAGALVGNIFGIALQTLAITVEGEFMVEGVWDILAVTTDTLAVGDLVYWDDSAKKCGSHGTGKELIGAATKAKINGDTTARVRLNGVAM